MSGDGNLKLEPDDVWHHLEETKAVILQGPPGTGKTYTAKKVIEGRIDTDDSNGDENTEDDDDINVRDWQWSSISADEYDAHEISSNNSDYSLPDNDNDNSDEVNGSSDGSDGLSDLDVIWELVQLHPSYSYEDFVRGIRIETDDDESESVINFKENDRIVVQLAEVAKEVSDTPVVLVLDEINRCNLADVLGELILTLEDDKRGDFTLDDDEREDWSVRLQYPPPEPDSGNGNGDSNGNFTMPDNLYVLGTMNTADQSIAKIDYAIRRRFRFIRAPPDRKAIVEFYGDGDDEYSFPNNKDKWAKKLANRLAYDVLPLLREYDRTGEMNFGGGDNGDSDGVICVTPSEFSGDDDEKNNERTNAFGRVARNILYKINDEIEKDRLQVGHSHFIIESLDTNETDEESSNNRGNGEFGLPVGNRDTTQREVQNEAEDAIESAVEELDSNGDNSNEDE